MIKIFLGLSLIIIINCATASGNKWCNIGCKGKIAPHILCDCSPDVVSEKCGKVVQSKLTEEDKKKILDLHNSLRQKVASGNEKRGKPGPQPKADDKMPDLVWDDELAHSAQTWANQCDYGHRCADFGDDLSEFVGQNIGYVWQTNGAAPYEDIVHNWYNEVKDFNKEQAKSFVPSKPNEPEIGHYTQVVWAKTAKVGCGGIKYIGKGADSTTTYLVCNYYKAGNMIGAPLY